MSASKQAATKPKKENSALINLYLIGYNVGQTVGWSYLLYIYVQYVVAGGSRSNTTLWDTVKWPLILFQNAAILEIVHAATGIVKSNTFITLMQVFSRVNLVALLCVSEPSQASIGLPMSIVAWSVTEIIRYSYYAANLVKFVPSFLTWLRYSTFLGLYPVGVAGELICLYYGAKYIGENNLYSVEMPNRFNFTFSACYFLWIIMFSYLPFFPKLFGHMLSQRKKILGGSSSEKSKSKTH